MPNKYTKEELIKMLIEKSDNGKVSFESLSDIVFDLKFPDELYEKAKLELIEARNDENRIKELYDILLAESNKLLKINNDIIFLHKNKDNNIEQISKLEQERQKLEKYHQSIESEFREIKERIDKRTKGS